MIFIITFLRGRSYLSYSLLKNMAMKKLLSAFVLLLIPFISFSQVIKDLDLIAPYVDGYAAVRKNNQWGFINSEGILVTPFRSDLIFNEKPSGSSDLGIASLRFPQMANGRSIIKAVKNQVPYYGFIDHTGKIVIEPEFLNVSQFQNGYALALKVDEEKLGVNPLLGKGMLAYKYDVVLIDSTGAVKQYLAGPFPVSVSREKLRTAPPIRAKFLSDNLISVQGPNKSWEVHKIDPKL